MIVRYIVGERQCFIAAKCQKHLTYHFAPTRFTALPGRWADIESDEDDDWGKSNTRSQVSAAAQKKESSSSAAREEVRKDDAKESEVAEAAPAEANANEKADEPEKKLAYMKKKKANSAFGLVAKKKPAAPTSPAPPETRQTPSAFGAIGAPVKKAEASNTAGAAAAPAASAKPAAQSAQPAAMAQPAQVMHPMMTPYGYQFGYPATYGTGTLPPFINPYDKGRGKGHKGGKPFCKSRPNGRKKNSRKHGSGTACVGLHEISTTYESSYHIFVIV